MFQSFSTILIRRFHFNCYFGICSEVDNEFALQQPLTCGRLHLSVPQDTPPIGKVICCFKLVMVSELMWVCFVNQSGGLN